MNFDIQPTAPTPIYRQIVEQVHRLVASGQLRQGDELPSVRAVAMHHAINPMTVSKAYSMLELEGLLTRRRGLGMVVAATRSRAGRKDKLELLRPSLQSAAQIARQLDISDEDAQAMFKSCLKNRHKGESDEQ
jgi:GntR family transcriptional regulator